jgi:hypothetical protein
MYVCMYKQMVHTYVQFASCVWHVFCTLYSYTDHKYIHTLQLQTPAAPPANYYHSRVLHLVMAYIHTYIETLYLTKNFRFLYIVTTYTRTNTETSYA